MYYAIHELPTYKQTCQGERYAPHSSFEGNDKHNLIEQAENYYCEKSMDNGEYGDGEQEVYLVTMDDDGNVIDEEVINLTWFGG
jgi:hypothetical protein